MNAGVMVIDGNTALATSPGAIRVGERIVPLALLRHLVVDADATLPAALLGECAQSHVAVSVVLPGRERSPVLLRSAEGDPGARLAQYRACLDDAERLALARCLVRCRIRSQYRLLGAALSLRPDLRRTLARACDRLARAAAAAAQATDIASLRGHEGAASACFFQGYRYLFPATLEFSTRQRRPPPDPVNGCLSLGYTLLYSRTVCAIHAATLDPMLGLFHEPVHGCRSLACDLMELSRADIEQRVWQLFRDRDLRADHFRRDAAGCLLGPAGKRHFYPAMAAILDAAERRLRRLAIALRRRWLRRYQGICHE